MKKTIFFLSLIASMVLVLSGCSKKSTADTVDVNNVVKQKKGTNKALRSYLVYKMSGDYANLVPVNLDNEGNLRSYPDPMDISQSSTPVALGDGWYLDRRGIGTNTAFLNYTYEEYHALPSVPSIDTLKANIKVRNGITEIWNCGTQQRTVEQFKSLVADGFPGCERVK